MSAWHKPSISQSHAQFSTYDWIRVLPKEDVVVELKVKATFDRV